MPCSTRKRLGRWAAFDVECRPPSEGPERLLGVVSVCSSSALAERVWERTSMRERVPGRHAHGHPLRYGVRPPEAPWPVAGSLESRGKSEFWDSRNGKEVSKRETPVQVVGPCYCRGSKNPRWVAGGAGWLGGVTERRLR